MTTRRKFLRNSLALSAASALQPAAGGMSAPATRTIPADGHRLPVIGLGTWQTFDVGADAAAKDGLGRLLARFVELGGELVDCSPMYGSAEAVLGALAAQRGLRDRLYLASKTWTHGRAAGMAQFEESLRRLQTRRIDLMQVHNLQDWKTHLPHLREARAAGRIRHVGISHYAQGAYAEVEAILRSEALDFLQINYSLAERESAQRLLPLAAERGIAVIANRPFAEGALFHRVKGKVLPAAAADHGCRSWAQLFLRWILAHPAVTCAIPASRQLDHLEDNMAAGFAPPPAPQAQRELARMAGF